MSRGNPIVELINDITDPILQPLRRIIPSIGGLDLTPIVALLLLRFLQSLLVSALTSRIAF